MINGILNKLILLMMLCHIFDVLLTGGWNRLVSLKMGYSASQFAKPRKYKI